MKLASIMIASAALLLTQGCEEKPASAVNGSTPTQNRAPSPRPMDLRTEALNTAEKEWGKVWIQNGEMWISKANDPYHPYLLQIKGRRSEDHEQSLSEADRLNGIQWKGSLAFYCSAARKFGFDATDGGLRSIGDPNAKHRAGWNEWFTPDEAIAVYEFKKQHNNWMVLEKKMYKFADMVRPREPDLRNSQQ